MDRIFPKKIYGRCPIGHNRAPSGATGDNLSTTEIDSDEEMELYWSNYYQTYICKMHERRVQDLKDDEKFHENENKSEEARQGMGFVKSQSYSITEP